MRKFYLFLILVAIIPTATFFAAPHHASAHEQYVLSKTEFAKDNAVTGINVWSALKTSSNLRTALEVAVGILLVLILNFFFISSRWEPWLNRTLERLDPLGTALVRIALGFSFIYSAATSAYLGPEILQSTLPFGGIIRYILYVVGILLVFGFLSEIAGFIALCTILAATWIYKDYMLTYFNYFGEFLALFLFGSSVFSLDKILFGVKKAAIKFKDHEIALLRITYGISVLYPAITIKLLHPAVILDIVNIYHLNQFHWLFPHDPLLISLGTGLAQILVGACIIVGFETRLASFSTFVLYTLSILFFKEVVWPHYILLALSFYLVINNGGRFSIDRLIENAAEKRRKRHAPAQTLAA